MLLVDAHVHLYPAVDVARLLDAAAANFARVATAQGSVAPLGVLMLTESGVLDRYAELQSRGAHQLGAWSLRPVAGEDLALLASNGDSRILVVAGRQVVTAEGLEVLQLATRAQLGLCALPQPHGQPAGFRAAPARTLPGLRVVSQMGNWPPSYIVFALSKE